MWISWTLFNMYFSKISQRAVLWLTKESRCRISKCWDTHSGSLSPCCPCALTAVCWWKADVFILSLLWFMCVNSLKHTEISRCIFQVLLVMILFLLPLQPYFMMQTWDLSLCSWWLKWISVRCGYGQENRLCERRTSWARVFSINNFHIQFASQTVQQPLQDIALFRTPLSLTVHFP